jgi:NAD dependent epimerase/dehydratase
MKKKILITGSEGFIGSHVTEVLIKKGYKVKAFVLYNSFSSLGWLSNIDPKLKKNIEFYFGDVRNFDSVYNGMKGCYAVMHLAALIGIPYSYLTPESYIDTNVKGTLNVLQSAKQLKLSKIVITSTSEVYGTAQYVPINESHPINPQSPYAASKVSADALAMSFYKSFNMPIAIIRPFNTFGPRQSNRAIIPTIINQLIANKTYIKLGNLNPTRDFSYVEDVAEAFYKVLISKHSIGKIINIGSNFEITIKKIVYLVLDILKIKNIKIILEKKRARKQNSEVFRLYSSNLLAKKIIKWSPKFSKSKGFYLALTKTVDWYLKKKDRTENKNKISYDI